MATAELAVAIPVVLLVLGLCLGALELGLDTVRSLGTAGAVARSLARGDPPARVLATARQTAPTGATVTVTTTDVDVRVVVRCPRGWLTRALRLPLAPSATAVAVREDADQTSGRPP